MMRRRLLTMAVVLAVGVASGARHSASPPPINLVIVTLDTTRADRLSAYGFQSVSMPAIDRLAQEGVVFRQATTVAPLTLPAHCSLLTGLYPTHHGVRDNADPALDPTHSTLAELLRRRGFQTGAFVATSVLAADRGLSRGFDVYRDAATSDPVGAPRFRRPGNEVVDDSLGWLAHRDTSPFFLWVHLYDAHAPYTPPEPYRTRYGADPYEGALAFLDSQVGRLIEALEAQQQFDRTLVVVVGDHGESLGDHGEAEHGVLLYESVLHVPLLMRVPRITPRTVDSVTSLVDVLPTVLGLLRLPQVPVDGLNLAPAIRGTERPVDRSVYAESLYPERFGWRAMRALRDGRHKLIDAPRPELYDLQIDPFEEHNLDAASATGKALIRGLQDFGRTDRTSARARKDRVPPEVTARLAALGYVSGDDHGVASAQRDPKDYIATYNDVQRASRRGR